MSLRRRKRGQSHPSTRRRRKRRGIRSLPSAIARFIARLVALAVGGAVGAGALGLAGILIGSQLAAAGDAVKYVAPDLSDFAPLDQRSLVLDRNDRVIAVLHAEQNRSPVPLARVPQLLINAILAVEDSNFYQHKGVNLRATVRAFGANVEAGGVAQGGSTITQQLVKKSLLTSKQEIGRKVREAILATELEKKLTKNQILERYLSEVYFGQGAYGVQAASERYFQKSVENISIGEAAFLAGMIRNPVGYDPVRFRDRSRSRRSTVLDRMVVVHQLTQNEADLLKLSPMPLPADRLAKPDTYFIEAVKKELLADRRLGDTSRDRYESVFNGGLRIRTTFDPVAQAEAERAVTETLPKNEPDFTAALASVDVSTGAVRAMVGGRGFETDKYNLVTQGLRQPGSSWKPFVFLAALEQGISPLSYLSGVEPCPIPNEGGTPNPFEPQNAEDSTGKIAVLSDQLVASSNCAFARLAYIVGYPNIIKTARRLGITTRIDAVPAMALGVEEVHPLEMAGAYATLASGGVRRTPYLIEEVRNSKRRVLFRAKVSKQQVADPNLVSVLVDAMTQVVTRGTGTAAQLPGRAVAGKTGTTNDYEDAWFVGFTPQLATAVWMGAPKAKISMRNVGGVKVFGGTYPARIWRAYSEAVLATEPIVSFPVPDYRVFGKGDCLVIANEPKATDQGRANARSKSSTVSGSGSRATSGSGATGKTTKKRPKTTKQSTSTPPTVVAPVEVVTPAVPGASETQALGLPEARTSGRPLQPGVGGRGYSVSVPTAPGPAVSGPTVKGPTAAVSVVDLRLPGSFGPLVPRVARTQGKTCQDRLGSPTIKKKKKKVTATTVAASTDVGTPTPVQVAVTTPAAPVPVEPPANPEPAPVPVATTATGSPE